MPRGQDRVPLAFRLLMRGDDNGVRMWGKDEEGALELLYDGAAVGVLDLASAIEALGFSVAAEECDRLDEVAAAVAWADAFGAGGG